MLGGKIPNRHVWVQQPSVLSQKELISADSATTQRQHLGQDIFDAEHGVRLMHCHIDAGSFVNDMVLSGGPFMEMGHRR